MKEKKKKLLRINQFLEKKKIFSLIYLIKILLFNFVKLIFIKKILIKNRLFSIYIFNFLNILILTNVISKNY